MRQIKLSVITVFLIYSASNFTWAVEYTEYKSDRFGIVFSYPEDWQREEESQQIVVLSPEWTYDGHEKAAFGIQITSLDYTEEKSLQAYFEELMQENNYAHGEPDLVMINEVEWFHVRITEPENNVEGELYLLKFNNTLYFMAIAYQPPESGTRFLEVLNTIVKSVRLIAQE
ncbi:MAG: hypothetical protein JW822_08240 [Spirochaetales bacterium]|nr:hypothetical protein [Spirochaetales bacterium]